MNTTKVIEVQTEAELKVKFQDLAHAVHNLRFYTKYWNEHLGYDAKKKRIHWEQKVDGILNELGLTLHNNINAVIVIKYES